MFGGLTNIFVPGPKSLLEKHKAYIYKLICNIELLDPPRIHWIGSITTEPADVYAVTTTRAGYSVTQSIK